MLTYLTIYQTISFVWLAFCSSCPQIYFLETVIGLGHKCIRSFRWDRDGDFQSWVCLDILCPSYCSLRKLLKRLKDLTSSNITVIIQYLVIMFKPCRTCWFSIILTIGLLYSIRPCMALNYIIYILFCDCSEGIGEGSLVIRSVHVETRITGHSKFGLWYFCFRHCA